MIDTSMFLEKYLQNYRFKMAAPYLIGDVLDFGGNNGELKRLVKGKYLVVNYDHSVMKNAHCDTIVSLAVIEHISVKEVFKIFKKFKDILNMNGRIFITTPTKMAKPVLEFMTFFGIFDKENMGEHKHYWNEKDIRYLAKKAGFAVKKYKKFQFGFNQLAVFEHK
ncbi:class I SAM-dependent methyltransferase [Candidatus Parcubacteria bacterium]|nr:class I SAM-dependent methyltransferase [Patescibacteria group bacterium]MCG2689514.1 class I SAM-dependent methyltransferase [Candidatus Parcubacteria bacterium]